MAPSIAIDPTLSVYELVKRSKVHQTSLHHRKTMLLVSYEIEDTVINGGIKARVFSAFQKMSRFIPQIERYKRIAMNAESIYVFGIMDVTPPYIANVRYVPLKPTDQLAKEWFLIADSPDYFSALATEEVTAEGTPTDQRRFQGVWSLEDDLVTLLQESLSDLVGAPTLPDSASQRNYRRQMSLMTDTVGRLTDRLGTLMEKPR